MKFTTQKEILQKGINIVQNAVSSHSTLPILSNLLLTTQKETNKLSITGTDLDIGISTQINTQILEEGGGTIPAKRFNDVIKELPPGDVTISMKKNNLFIVEGANYTFKLIGLPKEEFPKLPEFLTEPEIEISQKTMREMLHMTSFAISHDESRYVLNGLFMAVNLTSITLVATDGRRLALIEKEVQNPKSIKNKNIVPTKTITELQRLLGEEGSVKIRFGDNQTQFEINNTKIVTRLIEGEFPNYQQVVPKEAKEKIRIDREAFLSAIRRASLLTTQESLAVKLNIVKDKMTVSKSTPEIGELKEDIPIEYKGEEILIGFNPAYLHDVLKNIAEDSIELELTGPDKPGVLRLNNYIYIVLPMQL